MTVELINQATSKRGHIIAIHEANLASYNATYRTWEKFGVGKNLPMFYPPITSFLLYTSSSFAVANVLSSSWFGLAHSPIFYPTKIFPSMVLEESREDF